MSFFTATAGGTMLGGVYVRPILVAGALSFLGPMQRPFQLLGLFLDGIGAHAP
jgi:hypothetical protein